MIWLYAAIVLILLVIHTLASYVDRIYSELGKFLSREFEDNMEVWEQQIEPTLGFSRERLTLCAAVLAQLSLAAIVLVIGAILFGRAGEVGPPTLLGVLQAAERGHPLEMEIKVLLLHGLLHLAGYDHEADNGTMHRKETRLRRELGLIAGLIERAHQKPSRQAVRA